MNNGIDIQHTVNQGLLDMSRRLSIPLVASNDCHYLDKKDVQGVKTTLRIGVYSGDKLVEEITALFTGPMPGVS